MLRSWRVSCACAQRNAWRRRFSEQRIEICWRRTILQMFVVCVRFSAAKSYSGTHTCTHTRTHIHTHTHTHTHTQRQCLVQGSARVRDITSNARRYIRVPFPIRDTFPLRMRHALRHVTSRLASRLASLERFQRDVFTSPHVD